MSWEQFMLESNKIEGEDRTNPGDRDAFMMAMSGIECEGEILEMHKLLGEYLNEDWVGRYRTVDVRVGKFVPVGHTLVPAMMKDFVKRLPRMDAWTAHNRFEEIHPFEDLNGRVGRLIWLSKMGRMPTIPFLQLYYYQTLEKFENRMI